MLDIHGISYFPERDQRNRYSIWKHISSTKYYNNCSVFDFHTSCAYSVDFYAFSSSTCFVDFCNLLIIIRIPLPISSVFAVLFAKVEMPVPSEAKSRTPYLSFVSACQIGARRAWRLVKQRVEMTCTMKVWRGGLKREGKQLRCIHKPVYRLYGVSRVQKEPRRDH